MTVWETGAEGEEGGGGLTAAGGRDESEEVGQTTEMSSEGEGVDTSLLTGAGGGAGRGEASSTRVALDDDAAAVGVGPGDEGGSISAHVNSQTAHFHSPDLGFIQSKESASNPR